MRDNKPVSIDGHSYKIMPIEVDEALDVMVKLVRLIGSSVGQGIGGAGAAAGLLDKDLSEIDIGVIIKELSGRLQEDEVKFLVEKLLDERYISIEGSAGKPGGVLQYREHFRGRMGAMMKLVMKSLEVNFSDFFDGLKTAFGSSLKKAKDSTLAR